MSGTFIKRGNLNAETHTGRRIALKVATVIYNLNRDV
jgi:hypothetical protein